MAKLLEVACDLELWPWPLNTQTVKFSTDSKHLYQISWKLDLLFFENSQRTSERTNEPTSKHAGLQHFQVEATISKGFPKTISVRHHLMTTSIQQILWKSRTSLITGYTWEHLCKNDQWYLPTTPGPLTVSTLPLLSVMYHVLVSSWQA